MVKEKLDMGDFLQDRQLILEGEKSCIGQCLFNLASFPSSAAEDWETPSNQEKISTDLSGLESLALLQGWKA